MPRLFGTDGVRGIANRELTPELALALGRAAGEVLARGAGEVVIGRDTRVSGSMLEAALVAGLCSAGVTVRLAGVVPTPAVAFLTLDERASAGAMISASHNPVPDNGIKFFSERGTKLDAETEDAIEAAMERPSTDLSIGVDVGRAERLSDAHDRYVGHLLSTVEGDLSGVKVVLDCAYGAAWKVAPRVFREAGCTVIAINAEPDGSRINVNCGSTSLDQLAARVVAEGADLGLAFDGDADRVLAVDEVGKSVDGDRIIGLSALHLKEQGRLTNTVVVTTVMSNLGLTRALEERGIDVVVAPVGDRFVMDAMVASAAVLGGEQSGHVIFSEHTTTGDGCLTGLRLAEMVTTAPRPFSELAHFFEPFPQVLINVPVKDGDGLDSAVGIWDEVRRLEASLGENGRVLLRPSGTEPVVRVMVEASDAGTAAAAAESLAERVRAELGG